MEKKKITAAVSAVCMMLAGTLPLMSAAAEEKAPATSGTFGADVTWSYDTDAKTLTISGTGATKDCYRGTVLDQPAPWAAFRSELAHVVVSEGITALGGGLFAQDYHLKSVKLPESLTTLGEGIFAECYALSEINIPENLKVFGFNAFYETAWLKTQKATRRDQHAGGDHDYIILNNVLIDAHDVAFFDGVENCLPDAVTAIDCGAFSGMEKPEKLNVTNTVRIGAFAFQDSNIKEITLGEKVKEIEDGAFYHCSARKITIYNPVCAICDDAGTIFAAKDPTAENCGTIAGYAGSTAQAYAEKFNYPFEEIDAGLTLTVGDWNNDLQIGLDDAQAVLKYYTDAFAGKTPLVAALQKTAADINGDGAADVTDAQNILRYYTENSVAGKKLDWKDILK